MKRRFIVDIDIEEDTEIVFTKKTIREAIVDSADALDNYQYQIQVSEEPVVSLEYLQSLDNTPPQHIQEVIDARLEQQ